MAPSTSSEDIGPPPPYHTPPPFVSCYSNPWYRRWVLFLLFLVTMMQSTDRNIPSILLPEIAPEFHMTDLGGGMLNGAAFVLIYAVATIPLARVADMYGRKILLVTSLLVWSTLTSLSALATSSRDLMILRVGVGLGEAGCAPASVSLIALMYGPYERASAIAIQQLGFAAGIMAANFCAAVMVNSFGWRGILGVLGAPGYLLAAVIAITLRDPPVVARAHRYVLDEETGELRRRRRSKCASIRDWWRELWEGVKECAAHLMKRPTFVHLTAGVMIQLGVGLAIMAFLPTFLERVHGMTTREVGFRIAIVGGVFGGFGVTIGGVVGDYLTTRSRGDQRHMLLFVLGCNVDAAPLNVFSCLVDDANAATYSSAVVVALFMVMAGPPGAIVQSLVPDRMRATAQGFFGVLANMIGGTMGPVIVGLLSDAFKKPYGDDGIRYALALTMVFCLWGQFHWWMATRNLPKDVLVPGGGEGAEKGEAGSASGGAAGTEYVRLIDDERDGGGSNGGRGLYGSNSRERRAAS